jgi:hypothetical protein
MSHHLSRRSEHNRADLQGRKVPLGRRVGQRALLYVTIIAAVVALTVGLASPANAWPWSSHVTMYGVAECKTGATSAPAQYIWARVDRTGEVEENSVSRWTEYFSLGLNTIPSNGSGVSVWVYCALPGLSAGWRYAGDAWVGRPWASAFSGPWVVWA